MDDKELMEKLQEPFSMADLEWRVGSSGVTSAGKPWAKVLCYVTNRAIQSRLDEVFGISGWRNEFHSTAIGTSAEGAISGMLCGISVKIGEEWVTKYDGADPTDVESFKGCISDSQKRAAVQLGIGRYLYDLGESWAEDIQEGPAKSDGKRYYSKFKDGKWYSWSPPRLPEEALRKGDRTETVVGAVPATKKAEPKAEDPKKGSRKRVTDAIAKVALIGTRPELERVSDFADELVRKKEISSAEREEINAAVVAAVERIKRQEESPHNPGNKS